MPLETATHVNQLVASNPTATDPKSQGDDHIRLVKGALVTDFPQIGGVVDAGQADLSKTSATRTNWVTKNNQTLVVGQIGWNKNGNSHTVFDASNALTPTNVACNATNADAVWITGYPCLMGYNGTQTFGVRVDSARASDVSGAANNALGVGQTWQNVAGSRSLATVYTNTTGRTICVAVILIVAAGGVANALVNSVTQDVVVNGTASSITMTLHAIVLAGNVYQITNPSGSIAAWTELRT